MATNLSLHYILLPITLLCLTTVSLADELSPEEQESWLNDESVPQISQVNEGILKFIPEQPGSSVLQSESDIYITHESIDKGWVELQQCYENLDAVPAMQIELKYKSIKNLEILASANIGKTWIEGQSIQMEDIQHNATLCIKAQVRIFYQNTDKSFSLINGPFHRRFLDGYYPYLVVLNIHYPNTQLRFMKTNPKLQPGFHMVQEKEKITLKAHFEGILNIETQFRLKH